jgi:hypothetical protein
MEVSIESMAGFARQSKTFARRILILRRVFFFGSL